MRRILFYFFLWLFRLPKSPVPSSSRGLVIILIDGLSHKSLELALRKNQCTYLSGLLNKGYTISPYYCGPPSATTATEAELFFGTHHNIPGFTWFDRSLFRFVRGNRGLEIELFENSISKSNEFLKNGSCIFGVFSAGATLCNISGKDINFKNPFKTIKKLNSLLFIFLNPTRFLLTLYLLLKSTLSSIAVILQKKSKIRLGAMLRDSLSHILLGNTLTYLAELEILRESPLLFIDYVLYDEFAHAYGINNKTSLSALRLIDWCCESLHKATGKTLRKYDIIILSDHGQTPSRPIDSQPDALVHLFSTAISDGSRTPVKTYGGFEIKRELRNNNIYLVPSGSIVQVYFSETLSSPYFLQDLTRLYPRLIPGLLRTKEIGWILCREDKNTQVLIGKYGSMKFRNGAILETAGLPFHSLDIDPRIPLSLARYAIYENNGDLVMFGDIAHDGRLYSFEEHQGTHGGFYGDMTKPFIITDNEALKTQLEDDNSMEQVFKLIRSSQMGA